MKTTVVPAQVTTVEDKIVGNLSFTQLLLLITPVFLGGGVFMAVPPLFSFSYPKLLICSVWAIACMTLAIRIKGKILMQWIVVLTRYSFRPRLYLFNKNSTYLRNTKPLPVEKPPIEKVEEAEDTVTTPLPLHPSQLVRAESAISDPKRKFHLRTEKGVLRVYISEAKEESV